MLAEGVEDDSSAGLGPCVLSKHVDCHAALCVGSFGQGVQPAQQVGRHGDAHVHHAHVHDANCALIHDA